MIKLEKVTKDMLILYHELQIQSFQSLLKKYNDIETNPAMESFDSIVLKFNQENSIMNFIYFHDVLVGGIRINFIEDIGRISPIFILPKYQGKGIGEEVFRFIEEQYSDIMIWSLNTIVEEVKLVEFYKKIGYKQCGDFIRIKEDMNLIELEKVKN